MSHISGEPWTLRQLARRRLPRVAAAFAIRLLPPVDPRMVPWTGHSVDWGQAQLMNGALSAKARGVVTQRSIIADLAAEVGPSMTTASTSVHSARCVARRISPATPGPSGPSSGRVTLPLAGLYPSLHLNLSECDRKVGDLGRAREHLSGHRLRSARLAMTSTHS
jgi:hypothetical protein